MEVEGTHKEEIKKKNQKMSEDLDVSCKVKDLGKFRIDSFNFIIHHGLKKMCLDIDPVYTSNHVKISVTDIVMRQLPYFMDTRRHRRKVYPSEAKLRGVTYYAQLDVQLGFQKGQDTEFFTREFYVPLMVKSELCLLNGLGEDTLIKVKEDFNDPGGYFIVNGNERIFRHFVVYKRNYPLTVMQNKWKTKKYSEYGTLIRSVKDEHIFSFVFIHLLNDGCFEIRLFYRSTSYYVQVMLILKALVDESDAFIVEEILKYHRDFPTLKLKKMLRDLQEKDVCSHDDAKHFLGKIFLPVFKFPYEASYSDAVDYLFKKYLLVHLDNFEDKFQFLCFSLCKLHSASSNLSRLDDLDNPVYQEILSSGQTYMLVVKEGVISYLKSVRNIVQKKEKSGSFNFQPGTIKRCCNNAISFTPEVASRIATGNFPGRKFGLRSETGYTISLKRTNVLQLLSQFTAICKFSVPHFLKASRNYYPESWGFLCPTQTPEGENCGLYNFLASRSKIVNHSSRRMKEKVLFDLGVIPHNDPHAYSSHSSSIYPVFLDGNITGWIYCALIGKLLHKLRELRSSNNEVPYHTEIVFIQKDQYLFPGMYLFSSPCRLVRKILNVQTTEEEFIGVFEQQALLLDAPIEASYAEIDNANILSPSTRMIPFCEYNCATRNIFGSEKCKQALGLPFLNFNGRSDSKTYQLLYVQSPVVSSKLYTEANFDLYPYGTNVIVAVVSYSGFDMEDALVLNKASVERGLMHSVVYKTIYFDFEDLATECDCIVSDLEFKRNDMDPFLPKFLDKDGFPFIGIKVQYNDPILSVYNKQCGFIIKRYLERHDSYIEAVRILGTSSTKMPKSTKKISITLCIRKVPEEGDKYSNRHGGKGICSALIRPEDLPFTSSGIVPDVLFNPHGIPSRMSVGMLFEMAAAKAKVAATKMGKLKYTVEPFESNGYDDPTKVYNNIGEALAEAGFDYYGTEKFCCGTSGAELEAEVFCGCLYYLRLHHMVEEKYQVQAVGPVDERTLQPINLGRSGAIRFGEMERDAILSHGAAELTRDRLLLNSDKCCVFVCLSCHAIICPILPNLMPEVRLEEERKIERNVSHADCKLCHTETTFRVQIPYVLCYLVCELAVLGISVRFSET